MTFDFKGLTESQAERIGEELENAGFSCDEGFEYLYGDGWTIQGIRVTSTRAAQIAMARCIKFESVNARYAR